MWCAVLTCAVLWPFVLTLLNQLNQLGAGAAGPPSLVLRDMVVPHTMALNDLATGRDGLPRAVPQDTVLAWLSPLIPPPVTVSVLMLAAGWTGALGAAAFARHVGGHRVAVAIAPALTLWSPFVAERLLQGHWSVVAAGMLLPTVALTAMRGTRGSMLALVLLMAVCALTPTGLVLAAVTALVASGSLRRMAVVAGAAVVLALPWVVPTLLNAGASAARSDAAGAALFAARAEPGVGTLGALAGLGGIWNAEAVPASREALAPLSTGAGAVLAVAACVVAGVLVRRRTLPCIPLVCLAGLAVLLPAVTATPPGVAVLGWFVENLPGAGLVRDTQKFVVLALPGAVVLLACGLRATHRGTWAGLGVLLLVWAGVPALPRDVADVAPVQLDAAYAGASDEVARWQANNGGTARTLLWPPGSYRMVAGRPALDPALKMVPGAPVDPGYLIVDGQLVDGDPDTVATLTELASGEDRLAERGVELVLVQDGADSDAAGGAGGADAVLGQHREIWASDGWRLYEVAE